jgi:hypothetical protein
MNKIILGFSVVISMLFFAGCGENSPQNVLGTGSIDDLESTSANTIQAPFNGPHNINNGATLQAEDFDNGGNNVAYYDSDPTSNNGGSYRNEGVDLESCSAGGYNVGWINADEWMEYTCNVTGGTYIVEFYVAANDNNLHTINVYQDGNYKFLGMFYGTGGWQNWKKFSAEIPLSAGASSVLKIQTPDGWFNLDKICFISSVPQTPFNGPHNIMNGAILQAEDFDNGGHNKAFYDIDPTSNNGGSYRNDGVDIEACSAGGYNVGWINADEWMEYTCNVTGGTYLVEFYVAANDNNLHTINLYQDENYIFLGMFYGTGGWQNWTKFAAEIPLSTGTSSVLRIQTPDGGFNLDKINFTAR